MSKPTQQQLKWADMEIGVIIHYLMDIYNPEYKAIKTIGVREHMPASIFAPTKLDTDQWIAAAKSAGAKYAGAGREPLHRLFAVAHARQRLQHRLVAVEGWQG